MNDKNDTNIMKLKSETMSNDGTNISDTVEKHFFRASAADFKKIPGNPIAYWVSDEVRHSFLSENTIDRLFKPRKGIDTGNNDLFLRFWFEVGNKNIGFDFQSEPASAKSGLKWFPYNKGGEFRKWYGNFNYVVDWQNAGYQIRNYKDDKGKLRSNLRNQSFFFRNGVTWTDVSSSCFGARYLPHGFMCDNSGSACYGDESLIPLVLGMLTSKLSFEFLKILNPSLHFQAGNLSSLPLPSNTELPLLESNRLAISKSRADWDFYETSWGFTNLPLLNFHAINQVFDSTCTSIVIAQLNKIELRDQTTAPIYPLPLSIKQAYTQLRAHWQAMTLEMQRLEEENNRIFIDAYGLQDELTPDVPLKEITLTCNPHYRYGNNKTDAELEALLLADTLKEFISYAVGCMFGRYALDKPGLILANQSETIADYLKQIPEPIFSVDDNVIPMLDGDWFTDDLTERFGKFLKVTFGEAHYEENLKYIEQALGKDIRKYFLKDFYNDHLKRYKKRPIYWLFSSPKGTFNALIYLHRYRSDTVSVVLNDYLREFRAKLSAHKVHLEAVSISGSASASEKTKALKDIENHRKMLDELDTYEREVLYPLATEQLEIDLDDGVKVNYQKFGEALKKIPGLAAKED